MKSRAAYTLIELLLVVTLVGIVSFVLYVSYTRSQANQGLRSTTEQLADALRRAHVAAREARDSKNWGVVRKTDTSYSIVAGNPTSWTESSSKQIEPLVVLPQQFDIWFNIGTGETDKDYTINVRNKYGNILRVRVYKSGVVDVIKP